MKEFLEYNNDNILVVEDGTYFDFYDTPEDKEISIIEEVVYNYNNVFIEKIEDEKLIEIYSGESIKEASKKKFLEDDFVFIDNIKDNSSDDKNKTDKNKTDKNKINNKFFEFRNSIINYFLNFIYFCLKVIILFIFSFMIFCISRYEKINKVNEEDLLVAITPTPIVTTIPIQITEPLADKINFIDKMIENAIVLNEIIEGEKECIDKLSRNLISLADASVYFDKTQSKKEIILDDFFDTKINDKFYYIQNELKEIYIQSINLSKQIKVHYNNSANKLNAINDFESFLYKHNQRIADYEIMLSEF